MLTFKALMQKLDAICKQTDHGGGYRSVTLQPRVAGLATEKKHNTTQISVFSYLIINICNLNIPKQ